ncbi:MAG: RecQ family ATP-dependent DNA helicase [Clostridium sp.]
MRDYAVSLLRKMVGENADFHEGQWEAIQSAINNKRTLVVQKTGWGKSVVYFIASKLLKEKRGGVSILVSPLLSLMRNQIEAAKDIGVRAVTINSENSDDWLSIERDLNNGDCDIILISPERLANKDFMDRVIPAIKGGPNMIVIDEAHCISDWGHDFRPNYTRIVRVIDSLPKDIPVIATTATANDRVVQDIKAQLGEDIVLVKGSLMRESLSIQVIDMPMQASRMAWLCENIPKIDGSGIIYCSTTSDCNKVASWLRFNDIDALEYHSSLSSDIDENKRLREERENILIQNKVKVLVSTVALGMGFDKGDISFVIHFQTPGNLIRYYQEIGRAGRKLSNAYAVMLIGEEDRRISEHFINSSFPKREQLEEVIKLVEESSKGVSINDIKKQVNMTHSGINKCLQLLDLHGIIVKNKSKYTRTSDPYDYENFNVSDILKVRYRELEFMEKYKNTKDCYMKFIANELDDNSCGNCMKCANCTGEKFFPEAASSENVTRAEDFLKSRHIKIKPKKMLPAGVVGATGKRLTNEEIEEGRALSNYSDSGWGKAVEHDKFNSNHFRDELVNATVELIKTKWREGASFQCVAAVPSLRRPELVRSFGIRVANIMNIPFIDILEKPREKPEQRFMENSNMQAKNIFDAFHIKEAVPYERVLLIDDIIDSGWTLTACGALLMRNGARNVYPYALASKATGGGDE